jgi:putative membrane protein
MLRVKTGFLSGQIHFSENIGYKLFGLVPWVFPFLWVTLLVNSRGVAKLILRPWRRANYYGFWMIGVTSLLVLLLALQLEPFCTLVKSYWQFASREPSWYGIPWTNFPGWFLSSVIILIFTSLWFINKQPVKQEPVDFLPLVIWLTLLGCLTLINLHHDLSGAGILGLITIALVIPAAIKGGRSQY